MDWIHCNNCYFQPGQVPKRDFLLTSCGHIFCLCCERTGPIDKCKVCGDKCSTIPLTSQLDKEIQIYFSETLQEAKKILKMIDFQSSHRARLNEFHRKVVEKYQMLKQHAQRLEEENQSLKRQQEICQRNHTSNLTLTPPTKPERPLFCKNSQFTQAIQRGGSRSGSRPSTPSSQLFVTPSRPSYANQQYRSSTETPRTPASEGSSGSPASILSGHSFRSQNNSQSPYKPGLTPPIKSLSMLSVHPPRKNNTRY